MSTKQTNTQDSRNSLLFDPKSKGLYDKLIGSSGDLLQSWMNNPFGNALYKLGLGQSQRGAQLQGQNAFGVLNNNAKISGFGGNAGNGFLEAMRSRIGRSNQSMFSQATTGNVMNALNRQMQATQMGLMFNPLVTGEKGHSESVQTTSGLGTWLPQLLKGGLSAAMALGTGGASLAAGPSAAGIASLPASSGFGLGNSMPNFFGGANVAPPGYNSMFPGYRGPF